MKNTLNDQRQSITEAISDLLLETGHWECPDEEAKKTVTDFETTVREDERNKIMEWLDSPGNGGFGHVSNFYGTKVVSYAALAELLHPPEVAKE